MKGVDYHDTLYLVIKLITVHTLLVVSVKIDWTIQQLHVNNSFLHEKLNEEVYMRIPEGFPKE